MAEAMQGIMSLAEGQQEPMGQIDFSQFSPVVESYARSDPRQFNNDLLGGMAEADPAVVDEFIRSLAALDLPADAIDAIQEMIDQLTADVDNYSSNRAGLIKDGVPEELLPDEFDPAFFAALDMALDQLELGMDQGPMVPAFAEGGIINVRTIANELAKMGRNGDTMLAHITPSEARLLRRRGGSGTINPDTGLPEFFFKKLKKVFKKVSKGIKSVFKSIGKAVKKIASSTIGKIILTAAAVYFMGPAGFNLAANLGVTSAAVANGINTFAASTLVNVASGQKLGDAIKGGIVSGAMAGGTTAIFGGGVPGAPREGGPAPVIDKSINLAGSASDPLASSSLVSALDDIPPVSNTAQTFPISTPASVQGFPIGKTPASSGPGIDFRNVPTGAPVASQNVSSGIDFRNVPTGGPGVDLQNVPTGGPGVDLTGSMSRPGGDFSRPSFTDSSVNATGLNTTTSVAPTTGQQGSLFDKLRQSKVGEVASDVYDRLNPSAIKKAGMESAQKAGQIAADSTVGSDAVKAAAYQKAYDAALPGVLAQYGPLAGLGIGAATLMGAFTPENLEPPPGFSRPTGEELLAANPEKYGLSFGGVRTVSPGRNPYDTMYSNSMNPYRFPVQGGINSVARLAKGGTARFPRKTGPINGPGTGTSDSVPAMLSDGEFVFTAKAVRAMGQGSRRKGAKRMYAMMKDLERKGK